LTSEKKLGGVAVLSGYLGMTHEDKIKPVGFRKLSQFRTTNPFRLSQLVSPHAASTPLFIAHGTRDPVISHDKAENSVKYLADELG